MLHEILGMTQDEHGTPRRWFHDDFFDLFVRQGEDGDVTAMDLCFGIGSSERALVWRKGMGYFLDGPEDEGLDGEGLAQRFARECGEVPHAISTFVLRALRDFSAIESTTRTRRRQFRRERWQNPAT